MCINPEVEADRPSEAQKQCLHLGIEASRSRVRDRPVSQLIGRLQGLGVGRREWWRQHLNGVVGLRRLGRQLGAVGLLQQLAEVEGSDNRALLSVADRANDQLAI